MRVARQDPPWKVVRAFHSASSMLVHLNNVSGGILAGDRLSLDVKLDPGSRAQITTTGATRLYRHRKGACSSEQRTRIFVGEGSTLDYLPDPLIPYAESRHLQTTSIQLAAGSSVFWWDVLAPGRQARGELFTFERLSVETSISVEGVLAIQENFLLEPRTRPLAVTARMQDYTHIASLYVCRAGRTPRFWRDLEDTLTGLAVERTRSGEALWGVTTLQANGVLVRGLSSSYRFIPATLIEFWRAARKAVIGEDGVPPRKVY